MKIIGIEIKEDTRYKLIGIVIKEGIVFFHFSVSFSYVTNPSKTSDFAIAIDRQTFGIRKSYLILCSSKF